jgi:HK97 family phage prohead protease
MNERKDLILELKDVDTGKRTAIVSHAVYDNVDRAKDISRKGMFTKSWAENSDIPFYFNHDKNQSPGKVKRLYEDEKKAYTGVWFGNHTLGNDVMIMADEGVIRGASFEFAAIKKNYINVKNERVRELKEVLHSETSLLTKDPCNPLAGVESLTKAFEQKQLTDIEKRTLMAIVSNDQATLENLISLSGQIGITDDLYSWISWNISRRADIMGDIRSQLRYNASQLGQLKSYCDKLEKFCKDTKASDEAIFTIQKELTETKELLSKYDTSDTRLITEPSDSRNDSFYKQLLFVNAQN